jgi:hypothetical protein
MISLFQINLLKIQLPNNINLINIKTLPLKIRETERSEVMIFSPQ